MPVPLARRTKRSALAVLPRARLLELAQGFELEVRTTDSKSEVVDAIAQSKRASFERVLEALTREELKEICRAHGLDDAGKLKQVIVDRILKRDDAPQLPGVFEEADESAEPAERAPDLASVLAVLHRAQLVSLAADYQVAHDGTDSKQDLVRMLVAAHGITLAAVLGLHSRDDLRKICVAHRLPEDGRERRELVDRILAAAVDYTRTNDAAPPRAEDSVLHAPETQVVIPGLRHVPADVPKTPAPTPVRSSPHVDAFALPRPGELVIVRHRQYLVEAVHAATEPDEMNRLGLVCLDDDNQGRKLEVLWELELGARRIDPAVRGLGQLDRLDPPRHFAAYLHAIKWNCVTATNARLFQAPFRAGIQILQHQLAPLRKPLELPRANLFIADDVGLGKTVEAGLLIQELILRQRLDFLLVVVPASITLQWRAEMERRFGLQFEIYNRDFVARHGRERGFAVNPWTTHNRFIISYQTPRRPEYREELMNLFREGGTATHRKTKSLLVLDEAHTVAPASATKYVVDSNLTHVARELAPLFENRLFLSATPHNGHSNSFSALLEILDPQRFTRGVPVRGPEQLEAVMVHRLKKDLRAMGTECDDPDRRRFTREVLDRLFSLNAQRGAEAPSLTTAHIAAPSKSDKTRIVGTSSEYPLLRRLKRD